GRHVLLWLSGGKGRNPRHRRKPNRRQCQKGDGPLRCCAKHHCSSGLPPSPRPSRVTDRLGEVFCGSIASAIIGVPSPLVRRAGYCIKAAKSEVSFLGTAKFRSFT